MAEAEQPERLRGDREVTVDDVRQLVASATPHFAYQIRNRIRKLIAGLPADSPGAPLRRGGDRARCESLGFTGEVRGTPEQHGMRHAAQRQRDTSSRATCRAPPTVERAAMLARGARPRSPPRRRARAARGVAAGLLRVLALRAPRTLGPPRRGRRATWC